MTTIRERTVANQTTSVNQLILALEVVALGEAGRATLPFLWEYIQDHTHPDDQTELVVVGSAIRKFVSNMPMEDMGCLVKVLKDCSIDIVLETAKMIDRNYRAQPRGLDPQPELARELVNWSSYLILGEVFHLDRNSTAALNCIKALISMQSPLAFKMVKRISKCPKWFVELVEDHIKELEKKHSLPEQLVWLDLLSCGGQNG